MRYYQFEDSGQRRLAAQTEDGVYDLTSTPIGARTFGELLQSTRVTDQSVDELIEPTLDEADRLDEVPDDLLVPIDAEEVWAAGVTYEISEEAREAESDTPDIYLNVYDAERPELFLKATPSRTVGPDAAVGIRGDSDWDVPEPELGVVLHDGEIVGYTVGNDMSSRSIEGENPLYLPQAKTYDRCCSIGPCVATVEDPHDLTMGMTITRDGTTLFDDETSTGNMVRSCEELVSHFTRHNTVPERAVLLTGTSLVPDDDFTLREGDRVEIEIEGIGTLSNDVTTV